MLGIVATNPEINRTLRGPGILPNDLDLSRHRSYLPLHHGWIVGKDRTYWNGYLGQADESTENKAEKLAEELVRSERIKAWAAVFGTAASISIAVMLFLSIRRGS